MHCPLEQTDRQTARSSGTNRQTDRQTARSSGTNRQTDRQTPLFSRTNTQTDRLHCSLEPTDTNFSLFVIHFYSCIGSVCIWFVQFSTVLYIIHSFCLHSFRTSANSLCLLHIENSPPTSQSCRNVVQFLLRFRKKHFVLCYSIVCSVKYNLLWVKWDERKQMERSFIAYFTFCPVISRRVGRRLLSIYVTSGMNIETQVHTKRNRIKQHNWTFVFAQHI
jgi:hypothetical protein